MSRDGHFQKKITAVLFVIYMIMLTWIILFKMQFSFQDLNHSRGVNLIPFHASAIVNDRIDYSEIINNIIVFVPVGFYLAMLKPQRGALKAAAIVAGISLVYEILQFALAVGASDITDLINNTAGGVIGAGLYSVIYKLLENKADKLLNILAILCTMCIVGFLALVILVN